MRTYRVSAKLGFSIAITMFIAVFVTGFLWIRFLEVFPVLIPSATSVILSFFALSLFVIEWFYPHSIPLNLAKIVTIIILPFTVAYSLGVGSLYDDIFTLRISRVDGDVYILKSIYREDMFWAYQCSGLGVRCESVWDSSQSKYVSFEFSKSFAFLPVDDQIMLVVINDFRYPEIPPQVNIPLTPQ